MIEVTKVVHGTYSKYSFDSELVIAVMEYVSDAKKIRDVFKNAKCSLEIRLPQPHTPYGSTIGVVLPTRCIYVSEAYQEVLNIIKKGDR